MKSHNVYKKKELAIKFNFPSIRDAKFKSQCGTERKKATNTGFTNLMGHIQLQQPYWEEIDAEQSNIFCASLKGDNFYNWLEVGVFGDEPISVVNNSILALFQTSCKCQ